MYTLRRISSDDVEMNKNLGDSYTVIDKEKNPDDFVLNLIEYFSVKRDTKDFDFYVDRVYKFIVGQYGIYIQPLYKGQQAYIMTSDGKTFDNLSKR